MNKTIKASLVFSFLILLFNILTLSVNYVLDNNSGITDINLFRDQILVLGFLITFSISTKYKYYAFSILSFILLHLIFFISLKELEGEILFRTTNDSYVFLIIQVYSIYFLDLFYSVIKIQGMFDHEFVWPIKTINVYLIWVLFPSIFLIVLSYLTKKITQPKL